MLIRRARPVKAFTLLELIVVIVILGLLAALAIPTFARVTKRTQDASTSATLGAVLRDARALMAFGDTTTSWKSATSTAAGETSAPRAAGLGAAALLLDTVDKPTDPTGLGTGTLLLLGTEPARTGVVLSLLSPSGNVCVGVTTLIAASAPWCGTAAEAAQQVPGAGSVSAAVLSGTVSGATLPGGVTSVPVLNAPDAPHAVVVSATSMTAARLTWDAPTGGAATTSYAVKLSAPTGNPLSFSSSTTSVDLKGLTGATTYLVEVFALAGAIASPAATTSITTTSSVGSAGPTSGAQDTTFGTGSYSATPVGASTSSLGLVKTAAAPDGSFYTVGTTYYSVPTSSTANYTDGTIWRFKADGTLDTSFGLAGVLSSGLTAVPRDGFFGIALEPSGSFLVLHGMQTTQNCVVERYSSAGSLLASSPSGAGADDCSSIKLDTSGRVLIAAGGSVRRLKADLTIDTTFGAAGTAVLSGRPSTMSGNSSMDLALDSQSRPVLTFSAFRTGGGSCLVGTARLTPAGAMDTTFGTAGWGPIQELETGTGCDSGTVNVVGDRILVSPNGNPQTGYSIAFTSAGALDTSYGTDGKARTGLPVSQRVAVDATGRVYSFNHATSTSLKVSRLTSNGVLDIGFGTNGILTVTTPSGSSTGTINIIGSRVVLVGTQAKSVGSLALG